MKKFFLNLTLITILFSASYAQVTDKEDELKKNAVDTVEGWRTKAVFNVNMSQVALKNWSAGGQNSFSVNGIASLSADYDNKKLSWENQLDLGYGILQQGRSDASVLQKTDDKIDFASKYGQKATDKLYYAALLNFKTQFTDGFDYAKNDSVAISKFMAPAYLLGALGFDFKPDKKFSAFIAPVTSKTTFVQNQTLADSGAYGVEKAKFNEAKQLITHGKQFRSEFGGYAKFSYKADIMTNVTLQTKLDMFSNYLNNPENIDVSWDVMLNLKVNKYITVNINTLMLYDDDIKFEFDTDGDGITDKKGPRTQFKELFGVGFSLKL